MEAADSVLLVGPDPPDVIACIDDRRIGIEIRRIYNDEGRSGSRDCERHSAFLDVLDRAQSLHCQLTNQFVQVNVAFCHDIYICRSRRQKVAAMMVDQVRKLPLAVGQVYSLRSEDRWGPDWPEEVDRILGVSFEAEGPPCWGLSSFSWLDETTDEIIQKALDTKENDLSKWRHDFHEAWILLVIDGSVSASFLKVHEAITSNVYQSSYDHALILELPTKKVISLDLQDRKNIIQLLDGGFLF
jgi:hypothetical protein